MSKRARQAALMGFIGGALQDVLRQRELKRLEAADELKRQRLEEIRIRERGEDRAFAREQFAAQQEAISMRDERNFEQSKELSAAQNAEMAKRDERNFRQSMALQDRADARAEASSARAEGRAEAAALRAEQREEAKLERQNMGAAQFIDTRTGTVVNKPGGVNTIDFLQAMQREHGRNLVPVSQYGQVASNMPSAETPGMMGAPRQAAPSMIYDPKTKRLVPAAR